jgi:hypothetical protein
MSNKQIASAAIEGFGAIGVRVIPLLESVGAAEH